MFRSQTNQQWSDQKATKLGVRFRHKLDDFYQGALSHQAKGNEQKAVRPGILIGVLAAFAFMFVTLLSSTSESTNEIRQQIPSLHERYVAYATSANVNREVIDQRWQRINQCLEEIAHYSQQNNPKPLSLKVDELLSLEQDARNPVYQFGLELRRQLPPE